MPRIAAFLDRDGGDDPQGRPLPGPLSPARDRGYRGAMIVTGALLAESASVVHNKLNIEGGVVTSCQAGPDRTVEPVLVVLIQPEPSEQAATIDVRFTDPTGGALDVQFDVPESSLGGEVGFVFYPLKLPVPVDGRYLLAVTGRGGFVSLPLKVLS